MTAQNLPVHWIDHPSNPLIRPPCPEILIADPTFLPPPDTPDGRWHLFAHGVVLGLHHYVSDDGVRWEHVGRVAWGLRPFLVRDARGYLLFFERFLGLSTTGIAVCRSDDLFEWSAPRFVLRPDLAWEQAGRFRTCGNPCLVPVAGEWRLYYSAGLSWLKDCGFPEPRYIGVATAPSPAGPFVKRPDPILGPDPSLPWRNHGAGAIKVVADPAGGFLGFNNGIHLDAEGRSRSDIHLLRSDDGLAWAEAWDRPLVSPEGDGWKRALVYALDVRRHEGRWWMFYNARDGWRFGVERIGLATCDS